jgi:hypothetical protein
LAFGKPAGFANNALQLILITDLSFQPVSAENGQPCPTIQMPAKAPQAVCDSDHRKIRRMGAAIVRHGIAARYPVLMGTGVNLSGFQRVGASN